MKPTPQEQLDHAMKSAKKDVLEQSGIALCVYGLTKDNILIVMPSTGFKDDDDRQQFYNLARLTFALYEVTSYVASMESWYRSYDADDKNNLRPSEYEDKREMIFTLYKDHTQEIINCEEILRNEKGITFEKLIFPDNFGGLLSSLLPPEGTSVPPGMKDELVNLLKSMGVRHEPF